MLTRPAVHAVGCAALAAALACKGSLPEASLEVDETPGSLTVLFYPSASPSATEFLWDFGDGNRWNCSDCSCGPTCRRTDSAPFDYTYKNHGRYRVTVVVVDSRYSTDTASIEVHAGNEQPTACFTAPAEASTGESVSIEGACSDDDEPIPRYTFTCSPGHAPFHLSTSSATCTYATPGRYEPSLVVTDADGVTSVPYARPITVGVKRDNERPTIKIVSPRSNDKIVGPTSLSASAEDNIEVIRVAFYLDENTPIGEVLREPFTVMWNPPPSLNGAHTLQARAFDNANNMGVSELVHVRVEREP